MTRAFTLTELLVTLAVIAILAGLLIPVVDQGRARADSASCLANLRILGTALTQYLAEHEMTLPTLAASRAANSDDVPVIDNTLDRFTDGPRAFACPAGRSLAVLTGTSYYWNSALNGQRLASLNFLGIVSDHSKIPVLVDKEGWHRFSNEKVNHLYADGHVTKELRLFSE